MSSHGEDEDNGQNWVDAGVTTRKAGHNTERCFILDERNAQIITIGASVEEQSKYLFRLSFDNSPHIPHIKVIFIEHLINDSGKPEKVLATIRIHYDAVNSIALEALTPEEKERLIPQIDITEGYILYLLDLRGIHFDLAVTENLFTPKNEQFLLLEPVRAVFQHLTDLTTQGQTAGLRLVINGSSKTHADFCLVQQSMESNRIKVPLAAWYRKQPNCPTIQKCSYPSASARPRYDHQSVYAYFNFDDYRTVKGFGLIGEHEYMESKREEMIAEETDMKIVELAGADNRHYIALVPLSGNTEIRFQPGDSVRVCFDPLLDDRSKDWHANILPPVSLSLR